MTRDSIKKVVLAYSGGLDTSVIVKWLTETYGCAVVAFCADLGQGEDLKAVRAKALGVGASKVYLEDLREVFVKDHIFPMLRGNAVYEGSYLLGTSIARPLIARRQVEIARKEGADARKFAHLVNESMSKWENFLAQSLFHTSVLSPQSSVLIRGVV